MIYKAKPAIITTVRISPEFYNLCKDNHLQFSEAMRVGISLLLAEKGLQEYDNNLNIMRKITLLRENLEKASQELWNYKDKEKERIEKAEEKKIMDSI